MDQTAAPGSAVVPVEVAPLVGEWRQRSVGELADTTDVAAVAVWVENAAVGETGSIVAAVGAVVGAVGRSVLGSVLVELDETEAAAQGSAVHPLEMALLGEMAAQMLERLPVVGIVAVGDGTVVVAVVAAVPVSWEECSQKLVGETRRGCVPLVPARKLAAT